MRKAMVKKIILPIPITPKYLMWKKKKGIVIWKNFTSGSVFKSQQNDFECHRLKKKLKKVGRWSVTTLDAIKIWKDNLS